MSQVHLFQPALRPIRNPYGYCTKVSGYPVAHQFEVEHNDFVRCAHCRRVLDVLPYDTVLRREADAEFREVEASMRWQQ